MTDWDRDYDRYSDRDRYEDRAWRDDSEYNRDSERGRQWRSSRQDEDRYRQNRDRYDRDWQDRNRQNLSHWDRPYSGQRRFDREREGENRGYNDRYRQQRSYYDQPTYEQDPYQHSRSNRGNLDRDFNERGKQWLYDPDQYERDYTYSQYRQRYQRNPDSGWYDDQWRDWGDRQSGGSDRRSQDFDRRRQPGAGGMQADADRGRGRFETAGMNADYGSRGYWEQKSDRDINYADGDVGYESEGAFYQDMDEPENYETWQSWEIPGRFTGMGPANYRRSDERIEEEICERLTRHGQVDARDIEVNVKDGEVTMSGAVPSRLMKRLAEDIADDARGVKDIHNQIKVLERQGGGASSAPGLGAVHAQENIKGSLREGMEVLDKNGAVIGSVKEVRQTDFLIDRELSRDIYVPYDAVRSVAQQVMLDYTSDVIAQQDWQKPGLLGG